LLALGGGEFVWAALWSVLLYKLLRRHSASVSVGDSSVMFSLACHSPDV